MSPINRLLAVSLLISSLFPVAGRTEDATKMVQFADEMARRKEFETAVIEYERAIFYDPKLGVSPSVTRNLLDALYRTGNNLRSLERARLAASNNSSAIACAGRMYEGRTLYDLENYPGAFKAFTMGENCPEPDKSVAYYWTGLSSLQLRKWSDAQASFAQVQDGSSLKSSAVLAQTAAPQGAKLPNKKPGRAAALNAILPGAGYAYAGSPKTAFASFVTTSLFTWATLSAARKEEEGVAVVAGIFTVGWYFGGIYGSALSATRYNDSKMERFINRFEVN